MVHKYGSLSTWVRVLAAGLVVATGAGCSAGADPTVVPAPPSSATLLSSTTSAPTAAPAPGPTVAGGVPEAPSSVVEPPATDPAGKPLPTEPPVSQTAESTVPVVTGPKRPPATDAPSGAKCTPQAALAATVNDVARDARLESLACARGYARAGFSGGIVAWLKAEGAAWEAVDVGVARQMVVPGPVPADIQRELLGL